MFQHLYIVDSWSKIIVTTWTLEWIQAGISFWIAFGWHSLEQGVKESNGYFQLEKFTANCHQRFTYL